MQRSQPITVRLTVRQALRCAELGAHLWPSEELSLEEVGRRLLLEYLLWREDELCLVETLRT